MSKLVLLLTSEFRVGSDEVDKARTYQRKYGGQLEQILVSMGSLSSEVLPELYAKLLDLPLLEEAETTDWSLPDAASHIPTAQLLEKGWLPYQLADNVWHFITRDPLNKDAAEVIGGFASDCRVTVASSELFNLLSGRAEQSEQQVGGSELSSLEEAKLRELASEAPTVNLLNALINRALRQRASDMHVEPTGQERGKVRFRIDGVLQDIESIPPAMLLPLITRLKILSGMDIAEKRRPQDGKIEMRIGGIDIDIRVSALPLNDGESIVMRFLRKDAITYDMNALGIAADIEQQILQDIQVTAGVILLTGPTGSGKTTSLYTFLNKLNNSDVKIITLEDPVEYQLPGINQVQVQPDIGFDFAAGLRSIVRQDPDIIMLGEIRDKETAAIAMQSALTGHLVFSTVHTNDAPSAYTRLLDLGVEEFLLNAALVSIVAQRLVRSLCSNCSIPADEVEHLIAKYQLEIWASKFAVADINLRQPAGCEDCNHTGFHGRIAIIEYLRCTDQIKALPKDENFIQQARKVNQQQAGRTLFEDGLLKAMSGQTTIAEVLRVAG